MQGTWHLSERECMMKDVYSRQIVDMIVNILIITVKINRAEEEDSG